MYASDDDGEGLDEAAQEEGEFVMLMPRGSRQAPQIGVHRSTGDQGGAGHGGDGPSSTENRGGGNATSNSGNRDRGDVASNGGNSRDSTGNQGNISNRDVTSNQSNSHDVISNHGNSRYVAGNQGNRDNRGSMGTQGSRDDQISSSRGNRLTRTQAVRGSQRSGAGWEEGEADLPGLSSIVRGDFDVVSNSNNDRNMLQVFPDAVFLENYDLMASNERRKQFLKHHGIVKSCPGVHTSSAHSRPPISRSMSSGGIDVRRIWDELNQEAEDHLVELKPEKRTGWKTVRIFVSSTFKDFHEERNLLVKQIFPELRDWCEDRRLRLVEVDLRWGIPEELSKDNKEITITTCLKEIDRCYADNVMPYFLNMTSERIGWIPNREDISEECLEQYKLMYGLSVTEMEIVHAAYRNDNPNALFLLRDDSFVADIDEFAVNANEALIDDFPLAEEKLKFLKRNIKDRFEDRVHTYQCKYIKDKTDPKLPRLKISKEFKEIILKFFKGRISEQYPPISDEDYSNDWLRAKEQHEAFMKNKSERVFGRHQILNKIQDYISVDDRNDPRFLVGKAGMGKTTVMAKAADDTLESINKGKLARYRNKSELSIEDWRVFYHFVGAVPESTSLKHLLKRLVIYFLIIPEEKIEQYNIEELIRIVRGALQDGHKNMKPAIIFIDAIDQIDQADYDYALKWIPDKSLAKNVRCVISIMSDSSLYKFLNSRDCSFTYETIKIDTLREDDRQKIASTYLWQYRKVLSTEQMMALVQKQSSSNPLWLIVACEELRVYGEFEDLDQYIANLKDSLPELLSQVLDRLAREGNMQLLKATLCLLEVSHSGLLETELLYILSNVGEYNPQSVEGEMDRVDFTPRCLPRAKWTGVYYALRPFLRPYGAVGEGRLTFYHKELSRVVQKKYLQDVFVSNGDSSPGSTHNESASGEAGNTAPLNEQYRRWHSTVADYFERSTDTERRVEEYPHHLLKLKDSDRLKQFLLDWKVFEKLFDSCFSDTLLRYWRQCCGYEVMVKLYKKSLENLQRASSTDDEKLKLFERKDHLSLLFEQAGQNAESEVLAEQSLKLLDDINCADKARKRLKIRGHQGHIQISKIKATRVVKEDISVIEKAIEYYDESIKMMDHHPKKNEYDLKRYMALQLRNKAYALGCIADRCGGLLNVIFSPSKKTTSLKEAKELITKSLKLYEEVDDKEQILSTKMTEATLYHDSPVKQHKLYEDTIKQCKEMFCRSHSLLPLLHYNNAVAYEREKKYEEAYDQCREALRIGEEVYGLEHEICFPYKDMLQSKRYLDIAKRRGQQQQRQQTN